ncbi:Flagellar basal-body rod modification protein FlgD [hydrothermal vent metagenome]|uniref:Flagellar basal-body rod modification protein FlgD n=1 Tax=hydrothermal vent metagenome TaxID=652676 RepID=A0A3B0ZL36_9ZZZZ
MNTIDKSTLPTPESLGLTKTHDAHEKPRLGQEDFMKLMTAQMNHQDPMKPMENGEFITQMAQFSQVSGMKDIKNSFAILASSLQSNQALQASSLVGRSVLVPGNDVELREGESIKAAVNLPESSNDLRVNVINSAGELVHTLNLGQHKAGAVNINWSGVISKQVKNSEGEIKTITEQAVPGKYTLQAAYMSDGKSQAAETLVADSVESVSLGKPGEPIVLNLTNSGMMKLPDVKQIL